MTKARLLAIALLVSTPIAALADEIAYTCKTVCSICPDRQGPGGTTYMNQTSPNDFSFRNECGQRVQGSLNADTGRINIRAWGIYATISPDKHTIQFGNGTIWEIKQEK
jgi:hypothetical protein